MPCAQRHVARAVATLAITALAVPGLAGCVVQAAGAQGIRLATAYVPVPQAPHTTVAYVAIRNYGAADRLISAKTSAGGRVTFQVSRGAGASLPRTVKAIAIPAHSLVKLDPNGPRMLITGIGPVRGGKEITLTLVFARAGPVSVIATVTNPATGGSSYLSG